MKCLKISDACKDCEMYRKRTKECMFSNFVLKLLKRQEAEETLFILKQLNENK
jgi:hypothetical protein